MSFMTRPNDAIALWPLNAQTPKWIAPPGGTALHILDNEIQRGLARLYARRIAEGCRSGRHIAGNNAARADNRVVADGDARQDDRACADPDIASDPDRPAKLKTGSA